MTLEETTNISAVSQGPAVVNGKELSDYLGLTVEDLKNGSGVLLTEYDGTYTNLDGSVMVTLNESTGLIDMLVASDRDVGFTVCGVSVGMDREQAKSTAQAYVSDLPIISKQFLDLTLCNSANGGKACIYGLFRHLLYGRTIRI